MKHSWLSLTPFRRRALVAGSVVATLAVSCLLVVRARAAGIPAQNPLIYTGYLQSPTGTPVESPVSVALGVWSAATQGTKVCDAPARALTPVAGRFQIELPQECVTAIAANTDLWLEPTIDGVALGRSKVGAAPYAVEAKHAVVADSPSAGGPLATELAAIKADIAALSAVKTDVAALKARLDKPLATTLTSYSGTQVIVDSTNWTWVAGTAAATVAAGRHNVFVSSRIWARDSGCSATCADYTGVELAACWKVGTTLTPSPLSVTAEVPRSNLSLPATVAAPFDFASDTANVQFGLCAHRSAEANSQDAIFANTSASVISQAK